MFFKNTVLAIIQSHEGEIVSYFENGTELNLMDKTK